MDLLHFRMNIAHYLVKAEKATPSRKWVWPSNEENMFNTSQHDISRKKKTGVRVFETIKLDAVDHLPIHNGCNKGHWKKKKNLM